METKPNIEPLEGRIVTGNYEVTCALSTARQFRITGIVFSDDDVAAISKRVAEAQEVCDLQQIRMDIIGKEAQKAQHVYALQAAQEQAAEMLDLQKKGKTLTGAQKMSLRNHDQQMAKSKEIIASFDAAIKAGRAKLNGTAPA